MLLNRLLSLLDYCPHEEMRGRGEVYYCLRSRGRGRVRVGAPAAAAAVAAAAAAAVAAAEEQRRISEGFLAESP